MINKMKESLLSTSGSGREEDRIDAIRAFTYLLHQIPVEELKEKVIITVHVSDNVIKLEMIITQIF